MANEGNESRSRRMDLNLYLGLPRSPIPRILDLGSDLALSSLPLSTSSTSEESHHPPLEMSRDSHAPYSPSHASITPDPDISPIEEDLIPLSDRNNGQEYTPYFPAYDQFNQLYDPMMEPEGPIEVHSLPHPLNADPFPTLQGRDEPVPSSPVLRDVHASNLPSYIPLEPQDMNDEPLVVPPMQLLRPYIPRFPPLSQSYNSPTSPTYSPRSPSYAAPPEFLAGEDISSSRPDLYDTPEFRFRRLIETSHRLRLRRFRSSLPYSNNGSGRPNFGRGSSPGAEQLMLDIVSSQRNLEANGKHKLPEECVPTGSSEEEKDDKNKSAANFECNICMDMAQEPVVTSCGHLFCWPCLYQWLHIHCEHKECPVCKGEVTDANITPIYGRGGSETSDGKKVAQSGDGIVKIPPRPRGNRLESLRQQFRPISRRLGEGLATSWRRLVSQQMRGSRNRFDGSDPGLPGVLSSGHHAVLTRLRARRMLRGEEMGAGEIGADAEESRLPRESTTTIPQSGDSRVDFWQQFSMYSLLASDRLAAISANLGGGNNRHGASTSTVNNLANPEPVSVPVAANLASTSATDQASVSSTTAVIQGDVGFQDGSSEPISGGSSRAYRRRGRSSTSGSLDVDEGVLHPRKRRRTN